VNEPGPRRFDRPALDRPQRDDADFDDGGFDDTEPDLTGFADANPNPLANPSRFGHLLTSRISFLVLILLVAAALGVGSVHHAPQTPAVRIAYLESIIKCPSCTDLSIAQSNATTAVGLRQVVAQMVHAGRSDAAIETEVQQLYPDQGEILVPTGGITTLEWVIPLAALLVAAAILLVALILRRAPSGRASAEDEALVAAARRRGSGS
jgi:cytochrome c-type biogenesis protein CcmH/NrfF